MFESYINISKVLIQLLRKNKETRKVLFIITPLAILICLYFLLLFPYELEKGVEGLLIGTTVLSSLMLLISLASLTDLDSEHDFILERLNSLKLERKQIIDKIGNDSVMNTIQLSLNHLKEYYTINLTQARNSYRWSITAIIVGLVTLLAGIWMLFFQQTPNITLAILTGVSGILMEFIGASNIYVYNKSLNQLNLYFKELIKIQDTMLAIELCEKIPDTEAKKIDLKESIIINLINRGSISQQA